MTHVRIAILSAVLLAVPLAVLAEAPSAPDPVKADSAAPPLRYQSVFETYQSVKEIEVAAWRQVNDEVAAAAQARMHGTPDAPQSSSESNSSSDEKDDAPSDDHEQHH